MLVKFQKAGRKTWQNGALGLKNLARGQYLAVVAKVVVAKAVVAKAVVAKTDGCAVSRARR